MWSVVVIVGLCASVFVYFSVRMYIVPKKQLKINENVC